MKVLKVSFQNREGWTKGGEGGTELRVFRRKTGFGSIRCGTGYV